MLVWLPLEQLRPHPLHESIYGDAERVDDALVDSMRRHGLFVPLIVRALGEESDGYEILSGHRRYVAARFLGWSELPCLVVEVSDSESVLWLVESNRYRLKTYTQRMRELSPHTDRRVLVSPPDSHRRPSHRVASRASRASRPRASQGYRLVYAEPDWSRVATASRAALRLPELSLASLLDARPPCAPNAVLGVSAPPTHTIEATRLMTEWGFRYAHSIACVNRSVVVDSVAHLHHTNLHLGFRGDAPPPASVCSSLEFDSPKSVLQRLYPTLKPRLALWTRLPDWD